MGQQESVERGRFGSMKIQLIDDDGKTVVSEYDLGNADGEWDIYSADEADELLVQIRRQVTYAERPEASLRQEA